MSEENNSNSLLGSPSRGELSNLNNSERMRSRTYVSPDNS